MLCQFYVCEKAYSGLIEQVKNMNTNTRYIKSVLKTVEANKVAMPWTRGRRRKAFIEKRVSEVKLKTA